MNPANMSVLDLIGETARLAAAGEEEVAVRLYRNWLAANDSPLRHAVLFNLAVTLTGIEDLAGAEDCYRQALALSPGFLQARFNLGSLLEKRQRVAEALATWAEICALPDDTNGEARGLLILALNNSGRLLEDRKRYAEAEALLTRSLALDPQQDKVIHHWVHLRQKQCAWPVLAPLPGLARDELLAGTSALAMLDLSDDPALQLAAAGRYVAEKAGEAFPPLADPAGYAHRRLRVGYLSSDFSLHPVSMLTVELLELHDREAFEVYGFCWSPEDGSSLRQRVLKALDHHVPIGRLSDEEAAQAIRAREIDILVDLQGLTAGARPGILARRPAPVQVSYLGFPGTSGMPFVDYVLCDEYVVPPDSARHFSEQPLYLPEVFQVCDRQRPVGPTPTRADCGLPEQGFVYCAFNNNHKYTPELFAVWMNILQRVPGSVLWLLADNASVAPNLTAFCAAHGVAPERLVFAPRALPPDYLARYRIADLFLDCFPFNGGTTANDALWMGTPVLTCPGRSFASRMAGSLLRNVGLDELIASDFADYEEIAVALAADPARMDSLRARLHAARSTAPLFQTDAQVRKIEALFRAVTPRRETTTARNAAKPQGEESMPLPPLSVASETQILNFKVDTHWGISDPVRFAALMNEAAKLVTPGYYCGDNLFTWGRNNSLFEDAAFRASWEANQSNASDQAIAWRRYILACAAFHCVHLPGDFVECGVYMGSAIKTVIDYMGGKDFPKTFWGYDTYDSNPTGHTFQEQQQGLYERVLERFAGYEQVRLVKGLLPDSLQGNSPEQIAYLHIDLNSAKYVIAVLEHLFDRLVPGGVLILDDYEWAGVYRAQKIAEDQWFDTRGYRVFPLPTGQGIVLKR